MAKVGGKKVQGKQVADNSPQEVEPSNKASANVAEIEASKEERAKNTQNEHPSQLDKEDNLLKKKEHKEHLAALTIVVEDLKKRILLILHQIRSDQHAKVHDWLEMFKPSQHIQTMQHYVLFLEYLKENIERGRLQHPFNKVPPLVLEGLDCYIDMETFDRLFNENRSILTQKRIYKKDDENKGVPAKEFFSKQPKPNGGIYCYAVAFSDSRSDE